VRVVLQTIGMIFYPLLVHLLILYKVPVVAVAGLVATSLVYFYAMLRMGRGSRLRFAWIGVYALLAAVGLGIYPSVEALKAIIPVEHTIQPDPAPRPTYDQLYAAFRQVYPSLRGLYHQLNRT